MGLDLFDHYPDARRLFERTDRLLGFSLSRLCFDGPEDQLNRDLNAQMAVYIVSCILTDLLKAQRVCPNVVTGYSSGFYAAAYAAGCFGFEEGLLVVKRAGEILLEEGRKPEGSMAVIFGLDPEPIEKICRRIGNVGIAILNTPRQTVISGLSSSVKRAMSLALEEGALDAYTLPAQIAYHSRFMKRGSDRFFSEIEKWDMGSPRVPLISYASLKPVIHGMDLKKAMADQLNRPVRWIDLIRKMNHDGQTRFIEVGPGAVLSRTLRWVDRNILFEVTANRKGLKRVTEKYKRSSQGASNDGQIRMVRPDANRDLINRD